VAVWHAEDAPSCYFFAEQGCSDCNSWGCSLVADTRYDKIYHLILIAKLVVGLEGKIGPNNVVDFNNYACLDKECHTTELLCFQLLAS